jgi:5-methylcytosine-specific restriction enzyme subunit McrC
MISVTESIELVEFQTRQLSVAEFRDIDASLLYSQFPDKVEIEWPSPRSGNQWKLTSLGWVGFIPLHSSKGLHLCPKVPLQNVFSLLEYAYDLRSFMFLEGLYNASTMREFVAQLAFVLSQRVLKRVKHGLYKTYREEYDSYSFVRGRIDMAAFCCTAIKTRIPCYSEDHTIDVEDNQIIAWTLHNVMRSGLLERPKESNSVRKADLILRNSVSLTPFSGFHCVGRSYNRLNSDYEVLHKLCRIFLENMGPTQNLGNRSMIPFVVDMASLFELFVARWLEENIDEKYRVKRQHTLTVGDRGSFRMIMDILICDRETDQPRCVLDTKYKARNSVSNDDYNQVVAYSDALGCDRAALVYPKDLEYRFDEKPGRIRVNALVFDIGIDLERSGKVFLQDLYSILERDEAPFQ